MPIFALGLCALLMRLFYEVRAFSTSDHVIHQLFAFRLSFLKFFDAQLNDSFFAELVSYPYGLGIVVYYAHVFLSKLFLWPYNEFTAMLPLIVLGSVHVLVIYLLSLEAFGKKNLALFSGALVCFSFAHVHFSHWAPALHQIFSSLMMCLTVLFALRTLKTGRIKDACGFYGFLGLTCVGSVMYMSTGLMMCAAFVLVSRKLFLNKAWPVCLLALGPYLAAWAYYAFVLGDVGAGLFGKFLSKQSDLNLNPVAWFDAFAHNAHPLTLFVLFGFALYFVSQNIRGPLALFWLWAASYALPFMLYASEQSVGIHVYLFESMIPLLIMFAYGFWQCASKLFAHAWVKASVCALVLVCFWFLDASVARAGYQWQDQAVKASGLIVRQQISKEAWIFTDIEPMAFQYYADHHQVYQTYDSDVAALFDLMRQCLPRVEFVIVSESLYRYAESQNAQIFENFEPFYELLDQSQTVRWILRKTSAQAVPAERIEIAVLNTQFDQQYRYAKDLVPGILPWPIARKVP